MASGCIFARLGAGLGSSPSSSSEKSICFGGAVAFASGGGVTAAISSRFRLKAAILARNSGVVGRIVLSDVKARLIELTEKFLNRF